MNITYISVGGLTMHKIAYLFPGQGAQIVGMGRDIYETSPTARQFFDQANNLLDFDLKTLIFQGPLEKLSKTEYTQPALLVVEIMLLKALAEAGLQPDMVAGLSLGEYSALVASGALDPLTAVKLISKRANIMASALPAGTTTMAAILGLESNILATICKKVKGNETVEIANYNCPGQLIIGGHLNAVAEAGRLALEAGARKIMPLKVSGAFHTTLLKTASHDLRKELEQINFNNIEIPVVFNKTANRQDKPIIDLLAAQLYSPVRFQETIEYMIKEGVNTFIEVGPGKVLSGFVKKIDRKLVTYQIEDAESLVRLTSELKLNS